MQSEKKRASYLKAIPAHKNYYISESGYIYYKDPTLGKFATKVKNITKAKRAVDIRRKQVFENKSLSTAKRDVMKITNPLMSDLWFEMLEDRKPEMELSTLKTWQRSYTTGFGEFFKGYHIQDIDIQSLNAFKKWYLKHKPTRHAKKMVVHLKAFFKWCKKNKVIQNEIDSEVLENLHELIEKQAKRKPKGRIYEELNEVQPMLKAARELNTTAYLVLLLGIRCGMRKMEILQLVWENIEIEKMHIKVWSDKNHKWRLIPIIDPIVQAFEDQKKQAGKSKYVFPMLTDSECHMYGQMFDKYWNQIKSVAGIEGVARFHDTRHTFATRTAEDGWWTPAGACEMLDMSLSTYQKTYVKISYEAKSEMMQKTYEKTIKKEGKSS